jgi:hypothetical protein
MHGKLGDAQAFLMEAGLGAGGRLAGEVQAEAVARGITPATLRRAKGDLRIRSVKRPGLDSGYLWILPPQAAPESTHDRLRRALQTLGFVESDDGRWQWPYAPVDDDGPFSRGKFYSFEQAVRLTGVRSRARAERFDMDDDTAQFEGGLDDMIRWATAVHALANEICRRERQLARRRVIGGPPKRRDRSR